MIEITIKLTDEQGALIVSKLQSEQPEPLEGSNKEIIEAKIKSDLSVQATAAKQEEAIKQIEITPEEVK